MKLIALVIATAACALGCEAQAPEREPPISAGVAGAGGQGGQGGAPLSVGCHEDDTCDPQSDDCVCPDCDADDFCNDPASCVPDGFCDAYLEPCGCIDCGIHPMCRDRWK
jgi:hypothetical protein